MHEYSLEHIFSLTIPLDAPQWVGATPEGLRIIFPTAGGEVDGPRLRGRVLPGGGDWFTGRRDGVGILDVRTTIETHDGALIYLFYTGVADLGEDGYDRAVRGELPPLLKLRTAPRFQTAHPDYQWLNRLQCVGIGEAATGELKVSYDVYALR
ncbi:MAG: DUF3237 domain-containing protein [Candidatus Binatia bacterium]